MTPEQAVEVIALLRSLKFFIIIIVFALGFLVGAIAAISANLKDRG